MWSTVSTAESSAATPIVTAADWCSRFTDTSVVIPITNVDKNIDKVNANFKAVSEVDQKTQDSYDPEIYDGAHVAIQLVGRRLQEEKMIALAKYMSDAVKETA